MKIHHLRNATFIIESEASFILVDPMLADQNTLSPLAFIRFKAVKNPLNPLPEKSKYLLEKVTHCLITHNHPDHIDKDAKKLLRERKIPVICSAREAALYHKKNLKVVSTINYWLRKDFLGGSITGIPARHGYGFIARLMGHVMGFFIELPGMPSIYISSDTIYTNHVDRVLKELKPDIAIVACGTAQLDIGKPLLMTLDDIERFIKNAPNKVIANHLEALNHCPTTREQLKDRISTEGILEKVYIPNDGETIEIN